MKYFVMLIMVVVFSSCVKNKTGQIDQSQSGSDGNSFEVVEVVQGNTYTYMKVKEGVGEKWMAISKQEINPGDVYYYGEGLPMTNFHSKEIDRTFETIYFVSNISTSPVESSEAMGGMGAMGNMGAMGGSGHDQGHSGKVSTEQNSKITLEKSAGEVTVANIFANRKDYSEKEVEIRGVVVKVNKEVMGKNWIHIQDGTQDNGDFDLTVTSLDLPEVNDEITVKGKIILNKDFGYGYSYDVIMEEAKIVKTKPAGSAL
jgi:hypothetical protein